MAGKETKGSRRKSRRPRPLKIAALVVSAIQDLRETKGSTPKKITGYISYASSIPEKRVKRQVKAALKRGVEYGILRRYRGHYFLPIGDELDRANRIAMRFARLPTPAPSRAAAAASKANSGRKTKDRKRPRGIGNRARNNKKVRASSSTPPVSAVPSLTDKIADDSVVSVAE